MIAKSNIFYSIAFFRVVLLLAFFTINTVGLAQTYGLKFQSHDVILDKRTELNLSPEQFLSFNDEFEISFDYRIDQLKPNDYSSLFGYIFRIISRENFNIDLLITPTPPVNLNLVIGKSNSIIQVGSSMNAIDNWSNLRIKLLLNEDRLIFYTQDTFYVQNNIGLKNNDSFKIIFGASDYENFKTTDVPSISIKEIKIFEKGKLEYHWPLDEEKGTTAKNSLSTKVAEVKNPSWLKHNHQAWELNYQNEMPGIISVAADTENGRIFLVGENELYIYSTQDKNLQTVKYREKPFLLTYNSKFIYNSLDKKLYSYMTGYCLDISSGEWNQIGITPLLESMYMHHNSYFNPGENSIYMFGGYGQHEYKNEIRKLDLTTNTWQVLSINKSVFPPRYLAGLGSLNDTIYLLGGYGSLTGSQMLNPHSYFDLLGYSIKNQTLFKKCEIPRLIDDMCLANSMWIDNKSRDYYALIFEKIKFEGALQLIKGNIDHSNVEKVGDEIPFKFQDSKSYASLFYFPKQKKLFAYTSFLSDSTSSQVDIYSIDFPPNQSNIVMITAVSGKNLMVIYFVIILITLSGFSIWYLIRKRRTHVNIAHVPDTKEPILEKETEVSVDNVPYEKSSYQLVFFGGFQVFSKTNEDITNKFSPLLKELFILIMLSSLKNNKGISSEKISEYLWFDKSEISARNNRAVNIAKLKAILTEVGAIELTKKTGYWKINFDTQEVKSDYAEFLQITSSKSNLTKQNVSRLVEITQKGAFLLNANYEWLDDYKADVSDKIVDTLVAFAEKCDLKTEAEFIVHLADCIFNFDRSNEDAMILKCKAEHCLGKHSLGKLTYEKFIKEYQQLYNEEYKTSFNELIKS